MWRWGDSLGFATVGSGMRSHFYSSSTHSPFSMLATFDKQRAASHTPRSLGCMSRRSASLLFRFSKTTPTKMSPAREFGAEIGFGLALQRRGFLTQSHSKGPTSVRLSLLLLLCHPKLQTQLITPSRRSSRTQSPNTSPRLSPHTATERLSSRAPKTKG